VTTQTKVIRPAELKEHFDDIVARLAEVGDPVVYVRQIRDAEGRVSRVVHIQAGYGTDTYEHAVAYYTTGDGAGS